MGFATKIANLRVPASARYGDIVDIYIDVTNIYSDVITVTVSGRVGSQELRNIWVDLAKGGNVTFQQTFTMSNGDARVEVWSWYLSAGQAIQDDYATRTVQLASTISGTWVLVITLDSSILSGAPLISGWQLVSIYDSTLKMGGAILGWVLLKTLDSSLKIYTPTPTPKPPPTEGFNWTPVVVGGGVVVATIAVAATMEKPKPKTKTA